MKPYSIRRANIADARAIHEAHMRSIQEVCSKDHLTSEIAGWGNRPFSEEKRIYAIENQFVWVVEIKNKIEGYAAIDIKIKENISTAHIFGLYLTAKANGLGIGRELLNLMINESKARNVTRISLESTITAHSFYKKFGFTDCGEEIKTNIGGSEVRCYPMELSLI